MNSENNSTQKQTLSIAQHLHAILNDESTPVVLHNAIHEGLSRLEIDSDCNSIEYLENILGKGAATPKSKITAEDSSLPELLSKVLKHPDLPEKLQMRIWNEINNSHDIDPDSPEYMTVALGLEK
jgi:hypothetical protein